MALIYQIKTKFPYYVRSKKIVLYLNSKIHTLGIINALEEDLVIVSRYNI